MNRLRRERIRRDSTSGMGKDNEPSEAHRDQAALWLAKKSGGSLTPGDDRALEAWLNADRRHRLAYDELRVLYAQLEQPAQRMAARRSAGQGWLARVVPRPRWLWASVVPALALVLAWGVDPSAVRNWSADVATSQQFLSTIALPDGSIAKLGADTALALTFDGTRRQVTLLRGEAYFEVKHGPAGVFTVDANGDVIRDIGTKFNVATTTGGTDVLVTEGSVDVTGRDDRTAVRLTEGFQTMVRGGRAGRVQAADATRALSWMSGRLEVDGVTVAELAAALQRHRRGIIFVRGSLAQRHVSGTFSLTDVEGSLETLASAVDGTLVRVAPFGAILY